SKVETNNGESGAIDKGVLEEMKSLLHEFEGVETELVKNDNKYQRYRKSEYSIRIIHTCQVIIAEFFSWAESGAKDLSM
ncbi:6401_t:CDS:2, partial [Gigaspora margarita]